jgi:histidinol-phosphate aminotransferase
MYMGSPVYSLPAGHTWIPILQDVNKLPLFVASDIIVGETSMYADYIFPDVTFLERWEFGGSHPNITFKVQGVRQPTIAPLTGTVTVYGQEMALQYEAMLLALAEKLGFSERQIILGNGSNEIIEFLVKGFIREGDTVISSETSFLVYSLVTQSLGGELIQAPMKNFRYDLPAIQSRIDERTRIVFIANPNNPTGTYVNREALNEFLTSVPARVIVCLDEAYSDFVSARDYPDGLFYVKLEKPNVIVARTFSKSYGLAGLRVGYGVACEAMVQYLEKIRQPFNVSSVGQWAACAALGDEEYLTKTKKVVEEGRNYFYSKFDKLGLEYVPSQANFVLVNVGCDADRIFGALLRRGVIVRSMKPYGLTQHLRVTVGLRRENRVFMRELKKLIRRVRKGKPILEG